MAFEIKLTNVLVDIDEEKHREIFPRAITGFQKPIRAAQSKAIFSLTEPGVCAVRPVDGVDGDDNDSFKLSDQLTDALMKFVHECFGIADGDDGINDVLLGLTKYLTTGICHVYQSLDYATAEDARFINRLFDIRQECQKHNADHPDDIMLPAVELC